MIPLLLKEIIEAASSTLDGKNHPQAVSGISTDTRTIRKGELFIPLKGENFNGHKFIGEAFQLGASLVISQEEIPSELRDEPFLKVSDTLKAFHDIARFYRKKFKVKVLGITGSNGKTTTKDIAAEILSRQYKVLKNEENFNNEIGLPRTLLDLDETHRLAVLEMAMRGMGEIKELAGIALPDAGLITNIGEAHMERLGTRENILQAKAELLEELGSFGVSILNADDECFDELRKKAPSKVISFGYRNNADVKLMDFKNLSLDGFEAKVNYGGKKILLKFPVPGMHNLYNALAAMAAGLCFEIKADSIKDALAGFKPAKKRMEKLFAPGGIIIINDSYNANPTAVKQVLASLRDMKIEGKKIVVLGDMLELGEMEKVAHLEVGREVAVVSPDYFFTVGELAGISAENSVLSGMQRERVRTFSSNKEIAEEIKNLASRGDVVLIKGSRKMKMEEITHYLMEGRQ